MDKVEIDAPAKLNVYLKVLAKRPDGYHEIDTVFEKIALFDKLTLRKCPGGISARSDKGVLPTGEANLACRAAALLMERHGAPGGLDIEIEKRIPVGAGLGGGSSDAAATLLGLRELYGIDVTDGELGVLGRELGADVPFFLSGAAWARGRGRGDAIEPLDVRMELWHILFCPPFEISSGEAYGAVDSSGGAHADIEMVLAALEGNDAGALGKSLHNDLERGALGRDGRLAVLKERLVEYGAGGAAITGSGPVLFGIAERKEEVMELRDRLKEEVPGGNRWQVLTVPTYKKRGS